MSILIIAEAGVNHNGSLAMAKQLADAAKAAGADIVKFQTAKPELVISRFAEKAEYQKAETGEAESQLEMCKRIHLTFDEHARLKEYCDSIGIAYLSTPFDLDSIDFLEQLGTPLWKVHQRRDYEPAVSGKDSGHEKARHPLHGHRACSAR